MDGLFIIIVLVPGTQLVLNKCCLFGWIMGGWVSRYLVEWFSGWMGEWLDG